MRPLVIIFAVLSHLVCSQDYNSETPKVQSKRSYVCPPKFIRQGHRCYYFSKEAATWQDALFQCRDMRSNLAIIKTPNQDKLIRNFLSKKTLDPLERWLGGLYDWEKMEWKWAASGKPLSYKGFLTDNKEEYLRWHCIIMDPALQYRWNSRSCVEKKHFICHTKMKTVTTKAKKKLQRQYDAKLNEISVPELPEYTKPLKTNLPITYEFEMNESLNDQALFANVPPPKTRKVRKNKKKNRKIVKYENGTVAEVPRKKKRKEKKNKMLQPMSIQNIKWRTYKKQSNNPMYPQPIVEEYNFVRN